MISDSGDFRVTVRDPKARNTNDAAIRLAVVAIHSYCKLSGEKGASSRRIVKPVLENWRAYTGNTRAALASHQGIIRDGDALSLDQHPKYLTMRFKGRGTRHLSRNGSERGPLHKSRKTRHCLEGLNH